MNPALTASLVGAVLAAAGCANRTASKTDGPPNVTSSTKEAKMTTPTAATDQIQFYEDDKLVDTKAADAVPDSVRYVDVNGTRVAVAKVVARTAGDRRAIEQYSADGVLLLRTLQIRDPK
jgi:hypothetical protein